MSKRSTGVDEVALRLKQRAAHEARKLKVGAYKAVRSHQRDWLGLGPAAFEMWSKRKQTTTAPYIPPEWRLGPKPDPQTTSKVGVVVHVYYPELAGQLAEELKAIPVPFDVFVTNASDEDIPQEMFEVGNAAAVLVLPVENQGRDLAPLAYLANAGYLDPYDLLLKVHTKRSEWREDHETLQGSGSDWREDLLGSLLGDRENVEKILERFARDPGLGSLTEIGRASCRERV